MWDQWHASDLRQKRLLVAKHVDRIWLKRTPYPRQFDPNTIQVVPKEHHNAD